MRPNLIGAIVFSLLFHGGLIGSFEFLNLESGNENIPVQSPVLVTSLLSSAAVPVTQFRGSGEPDQATVTGGKESAGAGQQDTPLVFELPVTNGTTAETVKVVNETFEIDASPAVVGSSEITMPGIQPKESGTGPQPGASSVPDAVDGPAGLLSPLVPIYPVQARRLGLEGLVLVEIHVDMDGIPRDCSILRPRSHRILEASAIEAAMRARYSPAISGGEAESDTILLRVRFELEA